MSHDARRPAGLWVRLAAFGLDYLIIAAYLTGLVAAGVLLRLFSPWTAGALFGHPIAGELTGFLLITLPVGLYFALSEASPRQATWGKSRMGLKVTDLEGRRLGRLRSLGRNVLKFVPWELAHACIWQISFAADPSAPIYSIGLAVVWSAVGANLFSLLASPCRQTLYDRLARTVVVRVGGISEPRRLSMTHPGGPHGPL